MGRASTASWTRSGDGLAHWLGVRVVIRPDAYHIVHTETGATIWLLGGRWCAGAHELPRLYTRAAGARALADRPDRWKDDQAALVMAPHCGCCGALNADRSKGRFGRQLIRIGADDYRCDRHVGRVPCCIDGCGRTYDGSKYDVVICGPHWREAPRPMRDAVARVRRVARRRGWTDALRARHERLWNRALRAIREGRTLGEAEINALFGWAA